MIMPPFLKDFIIAAAPSTESKQLEVANVNDKFTSRSVPVLFQLHSAPRQTLPCELNPPLVFQDDGRLAC